MREANFQLGKRRELCICLLAVACLGVWAGQAHAQVATGIVEGIQPRQYTFTLSTPKGKLELKVDDKTRGRTNVAIGANVKVFFDPDSKLTFAISPAPARPKPVTPAPKDPPQIKSVRKQNLGFRFVDLVVTGVGVNEEQAKQNAYAAAIEQTLGMLVDSTTLVENEQLVTDEVLKYSDGEVVSFKVLAQKEVGSLIQIQASATVPLDPITYRLAARRIAVLDVDDRRLRRDIQPNQTNPEDAKELLRGLLEDFTPQNLIRPRITNEVNSDKTEGQDENFATIKVEVTTVPDVNAWTTFQRNLHRLMSRHLITNILSEEDEEYQTSGYYALEWNSKADNELYDLQEKSKKTWGYYLMVLDRIQPLGGGKNNSSWKLYQISEEVSDLFEAKLNQSFQMRVMLLDDRNRVLAEGVREISAWDKLSVLTHGGKVDYWKRNEYFVAPFFWHLSGTKYYSPSLKWDAFLIDIHVDDLKQVTRAAARIEPVPGPPNR